MSGEHTRDIFSIEGKFAAPIEHFQVVVIGAGPSGVAAATRAAQAGEQVLLIDENPVPAALMATDVPHFYGQRMTGAVQSSARMVEQVFAATPGLEEAFELGVDVRLGVSAWGVFVNGPGLHSLPAPIVGLADEEKSWTCGFDKLIVAAGARDLALAFSGWDQPGVMGANALNALLTRYDAFAGRRVVILGTGDLALATARMAYGRGVDIAAMVEIRDRPQGRPDQVDAIASLGVPILTSHVIARASGGLDGVESVTLAPLDGGDPVTIECDTVCLAVGLVPMIELLDVAGVARVFDPDRGGHVPVLGNDGETSVSHVFAVGDCAGIDDPGGAAYRADWFRALLGQGDGSLKICQCEEVARAALFGVKPPTYLGDPPPAMARRDLKSLLKDGPPNQDQIKRLTRAGMGVCQGRRCREQVAMLLQEESGQEVPLTGYRAPVRPLPLKVIAAADEAGTMSENWDLWLGSEEQWKPYHHIPDTPADAEHARISARRAPLKTGASVVVIGGGVTGLSTAWWLARSGVDVLVLDKGVIGLEASGRNGGGASHYHSPLFHEEQRLWPMMDELLGYPTEYQRERIIFATNQKHLDDYHYMAAMGRELGYRVSDLDAKQVREAVPLAGDNVLAGIHLHYGGHANPQRTVQAYAWALQDLGGRILQHARVTDIVMQGGQVSEVVTTRGRFGLDALVVAAGPQTGMMLDQIGRKLPLAPLRAEMIVTEPAPLMKINGVDGNGLYGRQTLRGNLAYGGGPHEWLDLDEAGPAARPSTPLSHNLAKRVAELLPRGAHLRVIRSWAGVVENTPDGRPVLDRLDDPGNVTVATMSGVGFGLSPATGHAVRDLVMDGVCSFTDISKLRFDRFGNLPDDWRARRGWDQLTGT